MSDSTLSVSRVRWGVMTAFGAALGIILLLGGYLASVAVAAATMPATGANFDSNPQAELVGYLWPIMGGIAFGLGVGSFQGGVLKRVFGDGMVGRWTAATMAGAVVGLTLMSRLMDLLEDPLYEFMKPFFEEEKIMPVIVLGLAAGMIVGLVVGVAQVLIGRTVTSIWPAISGVVWGSGFAAFAVTLASDAFRSQLGMMVLMPKQVSIADYILIVSVIALAMAVSTGLVSILLPPRLRPLAP